MQLNKAISYLNFIYIMLILIVDLFLPRINIISLSNLLLPIVLIAGIYVFKNNKNLYLFGIFILLVCAYKLLMNFLVVPLTSSELSYVLRPLKIAAIIMAVAQLMRTMQRQLQVLINITFFGLVIITAFQLMNIDYFIDIYASQQSAADFVKYSLIDGRVTCVFLNPNNLGFIALLFILYYYRSYLSNKLSFIFLAFIVVLFSQSRTIILATISLAMIEFIRVAFYIKKQKINYWLISSIAISVVAICLTLPNTRSLILGTAFKSSSFQTRVEIVEKVKSVNAEYRLFGRGKLNNITELIGGSIDNEYAVIYLEYGFLGLLIVLGVFISLFALTWKLKPDVFFPHVLFLLLIVGFTNLSFSNYEILPSLIVLCTVVANKKPMPPKKPV